MDYLTISPVRSDGNLTLDAEVSVKYGEQTDWTPLGQQPVLKLPESPRPLDVHVRVTSTVKGYWPVEGTYVCHGGGAYERTKATPPEFAPTRSVVSGTDSSASALVYLSRIRDATDHTMSLIQDGPKRRAPVVPKSFSPLPSIRQRFIRDPPIHPDTGLLSFESADVTPLGDAVVFEVADVVAPQLIGVWWPMEIARKLAAPPSDCLMYFHPDVAQSMPGGFYLDQYPWSWDFPFYGLITYFRMVQGDLLDVRSEAMGLTYQISSTTKSAVLILPVNRPGVEIGVMADATSMEDLIKEIIAAMYRKSGVYRDPRIGRLGLCGFSVANQRIANFLRANAGSHLCTELLREVYNFDCPMNDDVDLIGPWVDSALAWANAGATSEKIVRSYSHNDHPAFRRLVGAGTPVETPYLVSSANGLRSALVATLTDWKHVSNAENVDWVAAHLWMAKFFLTDAMRRSRFSGVEPFDGQ